MRPVHLALVSVVFTAACAGAPRGVSGPAADALARSIQHSVDNDAWEHTGAVRWTFAGSRHHLWDRTRNFTRERWDDHDVLLDIANHTGIARQHGRTLAGREAHDALEEAYRHWVNDSFWLDPLAKLFDDGTARQRIAGEHGHGPSLLIVYGSGGVTPGDRYQWLVGGDGRPYAWRMWVHVIPIAGLQASWEDWTRLPTGALIATRHRMGPVTIRITDLAGAATLDALEPGSDPFAELAAR